MEPRAHVPRHGPSANRGLTVQTGLYVCGRESFLGMSKSRGGASPGKSIWHRIPLKVNVEWNVMKGNLISTGDHLGEAKQTGRPRTRTMKAGRL